jgi:tetratricopeptide (TPR) repeat protein
MPANTVYISYHPSLSLYIAQPLFNDLTEMDFDVYMHLEGDIDSISLRQIAAREHFIMILTEGALANVGDLRDRQTMEYRVATKHARNILLLTTKDFNFDDEAGAGTPPIVDELRTQASVRVPMQHLTQVAQHIANEVLTKRAGAPTVPAPKSDTDAVAKRIIAVKRYAQQATIRLGTERMLLQAVAKIRQGDYNGALKDLDRVILDNPQNENAYLQRGRVLKKMGRKTAAIRDYEQATYLSSKMVMAHVGLGDLLLETERYKRALDSYQEALAVQSDLLPAIAGMALAQQGLGNAAESVRLWQTLVDRDDNYADPQWTGETFNWNSTLIRQARNLMNKR